MRREYEAELAIISNGKLLFASAMEMLHGRGKEEEIG